MEELLYKSFFISVSFRDAATLLYTLFDLLARFSPSFLSPPPPSRKTFFRKISHRHILVVVRRAVCKLCSILIVLVTDHLQIPLSNQAKKMPDFKNGCLNLLVCVNRVSGEPGILLHLTFYVAGVFRNSFCLN